MIIGLAASGMRPGVSTVEEEGVVSFRSKLPVVVVFFDPAGGRDDELLDAARGDRGADAADERPEARTCACRPRTRTAMIRQTGRCFGDRSAICVNDLGVRDGT
jgi:hypothetical protein